jgi:hypothetical protein
LATTDYFHFSRVSVESASKNLEKGRERRDKSAQDEIRDNRIKYKRTLKKQREEKEKTMREIHHYDPSNPYY